MLRYNVMLIYQSFAVELTIDQTKLVKRMNSQCSLSLCGWIYHQLTDLLTTEVLIIFELTGGTVLDGMVLSANREAMYMGF